jgi:hypothetical protein
MGRSVTFQNFYTMCNDQVRGIDISINWDMYHYFAMEPLKVFSTSYFETVDYF